MSQASKSSGALIPKLDRYEEPVIRAPASSRDAFHNPEIVDGRVVPSCDHPVAKSYNVHNRTALEGFYHACPDCEWEDDG